MKQQLRNVYDDLSRGRISRSEALERIKAIKQQERHGGLGVLLFAPVWRDVAVREGGRPLDVGEHHVLLCDLPVLDALLPQSHCTTLHASPQTTIAERYTEIALQAFERIADILRRKPHGRVLMQVVVPDSPEQALLAGLSGLLKTAAVENPQFVGQVVLVPCESAADDLARWLQLERSGPLDAVVRYRDGLRQVLQSEEVAATADASIAFRDRGLYLITGGLGRLGTLFAREILARTQAARVVLTGRSDVSAGWFTDSDRVSYQRVDLGDRQQVEQVIATIQDEHGQLNGILHCAGMIADGFILRKSAAEFRQVLEPKVAGTVQLDHATRHVELDFFVLFSSIAAVLGNPGQGDYAAANSFMDQFALYRNGLVAAGQRQGRTRSIAWPLWQDGGMALDPASQERWQQTTGIRALQTATGLDAFHRSLMLPHDQLLVVEGDLALMRRAFAASRPDPQPARSEAVVVPVDRKSLAERAEEFLCRECSKLLKLSSQKIDPQAPLGNYGIDSILAMNLTSELEKTFGSLSKTLFFEYQTIRDLAGYFAESHPARLSALFSARDANAAPTRVTSTESRAPVPTTPSRRAGRARSAVAPAAPAQQDAIAIIGISGRYPEAVDLEAYWNNLREGKDCVVEVPRERWDWREYYTEDRTRAGHHYSKWGGFIAGVDEFDPLFFNISPKEAKSIDPQERLFLQHVWLAIEDAGYTRAGLQVPSEDDLPGQVGVYVGVMYNEYPLFGVEASLKGNRVGIAGSVASIANRVSYVLNLHGPSMTVDTMCSSSLTAIHLACQDLKHGRTSLAIAGGVNVTIHPNKYLALSAEQFISSDGHCQSFGEGGDGYIPGEGVGAVVLKRLSEAKRDGDHIYGVIRGSALNHGGKTNGYTVPNPNAQASAIARALAESQTDPRHISYIEAHGTGTKLGDPIEIAALSKAFQKSTRDTGFCRIGSAKSNIGHCESAAGIAGVTKVLLQLQHREIVPSLHSAQLNPHIDFTRTPFIVNQALTPWEQPVVEGRTLPRIAGISSFGAGGSNAHVLVEEYRELGPQPVQSADVVIVLSARTGVQLQQKARELLEFVRARQSGIDLVSVAYTLQVGREAMDERLAFVVTSISHLLEKLEAYVAGTPDEGVYEGQVKRGKDALSLFANDADLQQTIEKWIASRKLPKLAELWVKGLELDWRRLYGESTPRRISLPTYPLAKERYWIDVVGNGSLTRQAASTAVLHPLLHVNTSDLSEQRYSSTFSGQELFLADRNGRKVLPAAACLEMARAAIERSLPNRPEAAVLELRDVAWAQAVVVTDNPISIALFPSSDDEIDFEIYCGDADQEILHCEGRAVVRRDVKPDGLDVARLDRRTGSTRLPVPLRVPDGSHGGAAGFVLHPTVLDGALQAAATLLGRSSDVTPAALESLSIVGACAGEMVGWARGDAGRVDVDLYDERGNVCVALRGLSYAAPVIEPAVSLLPATPEKIAIARPSKEIAFAEPASIVPAIVERRKPAAIALAAAGEALIVDKPRTARPAIKLTDATAEARTGDVEAPSSVRLYDRGDGVFAIEMTASASIPHLRQALERARQEPSIKVLTIRGVEHGFARRGREDYNRAVEERLYDTIASFPYPVVAILPADTIGAGFLFSALCDLMVCGEDARYGYTDALHQLHPTPAVATLFSERFGDARAQDLLYLSTVCTGRELRAKGWTCPIVPAAQADPHGQELAAILATKSRPALRLLKQHLSQRIGTAVGALAPIEESPDVEVDAAAFVFPAKHLRLEMQAEHVLIATLPSCDEATVAELGELFGALERGRTCKAVVLTGEFAGIPESLIPELRRIITGSAIPTIAAPLGNLTGNAWLLCVFCDAAVYSRTATCSVGITNDVALAQSAAVLFPLRFGEAGREIVLTGAGYTGTALSRRADSAIVVEEHEVLSSAVTIAASWSTWPRTTLASWKRRSADIIDERISRLLPWEGEERGVEAQIVEPAPIALQSGVVRATAHPGGIVVVRMEDRDAKNMFSDALMAGMDEVFAHIDRTPDYKVVILTGYDHYFASGGTKEGLLAIQAGKSRFTDSKTFRLPLDCKLPVIAAMQGHGIGAGWSLGMFSDLAILSEESRYVSPYMDYGFTPGAGATWSLPDKLGQDIARESLLTAQPAAGAALKSRGLRLPVVPRAEVEFAAMALARQIARMPRRSLLALKRQWKASVHEPLEEAVRRELAMHEVTFVGQADALARIQESFREETAETAQAHVATQPSRADDDALAAVSAILRTLLANELQMRESDIDEDTQFVDLGLDSISGVSWIRKINEHYRTSIEATKVYSHPTLTQLSRYVHAEAEAQGTLPIAQEKIPTESSAVVVPAPETRTPRRRRKSSRATVAAAPPSRRAQPIAIVGMAGQFPQAKNLDEFWRNLAEGRDCITEVPPLRWDVDAFYRPGDVVPEKTNSRWVGALEAFDRFDPLFFNISPTEAEFMDPQQRLFLQVCWHGIENAGYDASTLSGSRCGVFVGCAAGEYQELSRRHRLSAQGFTGNASSILAARISYFLNLQGPSVSVDTACSSSLVTIAQACDALSSGDIDLALAGGVYVMAGPEMHIRSAQAGMLSPEGRCYTFDQRANGFVPGEGVGVVVLKRLADAERDQDIIHGVVEGWGTNQDGKTNGITAPNPESQTRLMRDVYDKYAIDPANIQLIEAHGTGTKLGDPIEVEALKASFQHHAREKHSCALGSVKSNIGHCLTAAGIAGTLKLVLALQHRQLPPTINFERLNEHIDLSESPFYVNTRLDAWEPKGGARRQAAISSFGFSGTNAHLVIGEYRPAVEAERAVSIVPDGTATIVPLSAKTTNQLRQKARDLLGFIRNAAQPAELAEIAYTLQVGREAMDERVAFVVSSVAQLAERLQAWIDGDRSLDGAWQGRAQRSKDALSLLGSDADPQRTIESWIASRRLSKLAEVWVKGVALDWNELHGQTRPRRIPLPVYPFAEERYWIDAAAIAAETGAATALLHPLLHENASDLEETRFRSTFTGLEPFLTERAGRKILSAAACLEMARAAVEHALPARSDSKTLELRDTVWAQPIVVVAGTQVQVALYADGEDQIDYEIYTEADEQEIVHCRGRAMLTATPARATVDPPREHGPGAEFRLPAAEGAGDYVLHPASIDAALQAAASWIDRGSGPSRQPFALEALRIVAPCSAEMVARVRGDASRVEIDLCDANGKVCVELRGLSLRVTNSDVGSVIAIPQWQTREVVSTSAPAFTERHVVLCELPRVDAGHLASLLPRSHCAAVEVDPQRNIAQRYGEHAVACFERVQAILARQVEGPVLVQIVIGEDEERAVLAGLSGILKTAALEHSRLVGQLLLVPPDITTDELGTLLEQEQGLDPLVRSARDKRQVLRWQELEDTPDMPPVAFRDDGVYLITGGLGGLGLLFARAILESARDARVVLTGRAAAIPETRARLEALSPHVDRVTYQSLDLGDLAQVRQLIADVVARHRRLDGVLHAAGMTADNFVSRKTSAEFAAVLAPKVAGTFHLDEATRDVPLDFFALFSSIASAVGNPGQADYAAANGFLDHFAAWRNRQVAAKQRHGLTRAVNWSLWQAGGMAIDRATQELVQQTIGAQPLRSATGLQAFHRSLAIASDQMLVVEGNRGRIRGYLQKARMLESAPDAERATAEPETKAAIGLGELQQQLKAAIAGVLRIDASIIDVDQPFAEFGLDSFLGAELIVAINRKYGTDLSHSRLFDYSTVREFAAFLGPEIRQLAADSGDRAPAPRGSAPLEAASFPVLERTVRRRTTATRASSDDRIAVIGMSGRYPQANDLRQYWANLVTGRNSIVEVPASRWDVDRYYDPDRSRKDKTYSRWLGALDDFDRFDPLFFRISPQEAEYMDPQQRLFLQESYRAFEDAGYSTATLSNRKCGVYLGISTNEYMSLLSKKGVMSAPVTSNSSAIAAARISYYLNLKGPAISVDTACSSSLVAIHLACQALLNGEIDMALAGGVSLWLSADSYVAMSQAGMFSPDGQCKTFDESANGIVNGEGVGAVVLKRLHEAEAAGDLIYGVILGSGINQDGRTNGITAPSVNSQIELERSLYARHQIDPETITYVETHGTGTKLGDPIELEALSTVFKEKTSRTNFCALGSVKSNIGHTTSAAGVAGLQKVLLSMRHRTLVPTLNVTKENSRFDLQRSPFYISSETKPWEVGPGALRRAAVSSFGFSGTNAHLVVEEYRSPALHVAAPVESGPTIVPLSARTPEQLRRRVHDLLEFVRAAQEPLDLASIAWTLQVGREAMEERLGLVVRSVDQLAEKLSAWAGGEKELDGVYQGRVEPGSDGMTIIGRDDDMLEAIERWIARGKLTALVDLWVRGLDLDWNKLRGEAKPRRVSLPAYPFATERCWIDDPSPGAELDDLIVDADWKSIEQIIERIADDAIDTEHAVRALRMIV